jgi:hypothetical protein
MIMCHLIKIVQKVGCIFKGFALRNRLQNSTYKLRHTGGFDMNEA